MASSLVNRPLSFLTYLIYGASLSAINAENQQIVKQAPNFTPKSVKLGAFVLYLRFILENRDTTNVIG